MPKRTPLPRLLTTFLTLATLASPLVAIGARAADHQIFIGSCQGAKTDFDLNLERACKEYPGKILVRCKEECLERKMLKCVKSRWVQTEVLADASICSKGGDSNKVKDCSTTELETLQTARNSAIQQTRTLAEKVKNVRDTTQKKKAASASDWSAAAQCLDKVMASYQTPYKFMCPENDQGVRGKNCENHPGVLAYDHAGGANTITLCKAYFSFNAEIRAGVILHETTHEVCRTKDSGPHGGYYSSSREIRSKEPWSTTASTYDHWLTDGFCIPSQNACVPYDQWLSMNRP